MGTYLMSRGKYIQARSYFERALKIYERLGNPKHPELVPILFNLGIIMVHLKQFVFARNYLRRARAICKNREVDYIECQQIEEAWQGLPGKIGKPKRKRKKR
jgi:Tfp pilus assembly protein PilF